VASGALVDGAFWELPLRDLVRLLFLPSDFLADLMVEALDLIERASEFLNSSYIF
jgi:hypothetical protein